MNFVPIVDISRHQGSVDFELMASRGVRGVILRLGNGRVLDDRAGLYVPAAKAAGLWVAPYWFMNPTQDARGADQADRMLTRAHELNVERKPMFDVESFAKEPWGRFTSFASNKTGYRSWMADAVAHANEQVGMPIVYTGAPYWNGAVGGNVGETDIFLARYPFYTPTSPQPPSEADNWDDWIMNATRSRPALPAGYDHWDAWQFSAGFNRMGSAFGVSSTDLDLDIVTEEAWERWTGRLGEAVTTPQEVLIVASSPPPAPLVPPTDSEEDHMYIVDGVDRGSAVVKLVIVDGKPHHQMFGYDTPEERNCWADGVPHVAKSAAEFDALIASKV